MSKKPKNASVSALNDNAALREQEAHNDLVTALTRIKNGEPNVVTVKPMAKITASMVAEEAGRSRAILYTTHKDVLKQIDKANKSRGSVRKKEREASLNEEQRKQDVINQLNDDKRKLAQENYRLQLLVEELKNNLKSQKQISKIR